MATQGTGLYHNGININELMLGRLISINTKTNNWLLLSCAKTKQNKKQLPVMSQIFCFFNLQYFYCRLVFMLWAGVCIQEKGEGGERERKPNRILRKTKTKKQEIIQKLITIHKYLLLYRSILWLSMLGK